MIRLNSGSENKKLKLLKDKGLKVKYPPSGKMK